MTASIVVADDDLWVLRMIATVLERRGHAVRLASAGDEALELARAQPPDLVITDINMPRMDGWELISALREIEALKDVAVLVLSELVDEDSRVKGYRLGVEDYMAKPFRFEELDIRVANVLARNAALRGRRPDASANQRVGLVGTIEQVGLSSLLTLLELDRKSGVLSVTRETTGGSQQAQISIVCGRCHAAEIAGRPLPRDAECIYELLSWPEGRFEFDQRELTVDDRIGRSTTGLLIEAARLADEAAR